MILMIMMIMTMIIMVVIQSICHVHMLMTKMTIGFFLSIVIMVKIWWITLLMSNDADNDHVDNHVDDDDDNDDDDDDDNADVWL